VVAFSLSEQGFMVSSHAAYSSDSLLRLDYRIAPDLFFIFWVCFFFSHQLLEEPKFIKILQDFPLS
jgi:hypothetical protein